MLYSKILFAVLALAIMGSAHGESRCQLTLKPETSGFFLNPTLVKVVVAKAVAAKPGEPCKFEANDELLQVNDKVIPGQKAKEVMSYWKSLPKGAPRTFTIRRAGEILSVVSH